MSEIRDLHTVPTIRVFSGHLVNPTDLDPEHIRIEDIAHALGNLCRFGGHVRQFYSVAQHSVLVSEHSNTPLWGLLHDASEAYLVDLPKPLKRHTDLGPVYLEIEERLMRVICQRFGLREDQPADVDYWDKVLLVTEQRDLVNGFTPSYDVAPLRERIIPWTPPRAEWEFLCRYRQLMGPL